MNSHDVLMLIETTGTVEVDPCERCVSKAQNTYLCGHELGDRSYCQICE